MFMPLTPGAIWRRNQLARLAALFHAGDPPVRHEVRAGTAGLRWRQCRAFASSRTSALRCSGIGS